MENDPKNPSLSPEGGAESSGPQAAAASGDVSAQMNSLLDEPATEDQAKKSKSKLVKIVICVIVGVVLIGGGVAGALWVTNRQKPENVVLNAMVKTINQKAVKMTGDLTIKPGEGTGVASMRIKSSGESSILPSSSETTITIATEDGDELEVKSSEIYLADGVLYFRVDGLADTVKSVLRKVMDEMTAGMGAFYDDEGQEMSKYMDGIGEILTDIEGTWWRFDIADFGVPEEAGDMYDCAVGAVSSLNTTRTKDELTKLYKNYPLLDAKKAGEKQGDYEGYDVTLNAANAAGFLNNLRTTGFYQDFSGCVKSIDGDIDTDYGNIGASDIGNLNDMPTFRLFIHPWSHELRSVSMNFSDVDVSMTGSMTLEFIDAVNVAAPEGAKPVKELVEGVAMKVCDLFIVGSAGTEGLTMEDCLEAMTDTYLDGLLMSGLGSGL